MQESTRLHKMRVQHSDRWCAVKERVSETPHTTMAALAVYAEAATDHA
jgi:hypothetical protein